MIQTKFKNWLTGRPLIAALSHCKSKLYNFEIQKLTLVSNFWKTGLTGNDKFRFKLRFIAYCCIFSTICCLWSTTECVENKKWEMLSIICDETYRLGKVWLGFLSGLAEDQQPWQPAEAHRWSPQLWGWILVWNGKHLLSASLWNNH